LRKNAIIPRSKSVFNPEPEPAVEPKPKPDPKPVYVPDFGPDGFQPTHMVGDYSVMRLMAPYGVGYFRRDGKRIVPGPHLPVMKNEEYEEARQRSLVLPLDEFLLCAQAVVLRDRAENGPRVAVWRGGDQVEYERPEEGGGHVRRILTIPAEIAVVAARMGKDGRPMTALKLDDEEL
jgi:hypothetical protein